ncbi:DMT family transporter [Photobacterium iliopiscarium]|jgi:drug/metabolite transporter (DMT)-like permease|uniref:EamA family transporter n=1 Tax=Photobacterium iliopiscarium TaxID=56192 RepID=A0A2T3MJP7_9GAMM|nr:DMT family transporter [Photobacterium iliopiscarium]MCD9468664.1 EamA family transporter [Photobacterium iliopiscarium]MCD9488797.1 EamA family transporter [Photobacterium iliopiscarium]MCF2245524.1 EamA family transporter [Photobacterium iliopiscarium]PST93465.1 EamA family transporter [Photobacterium iliopiscarium]PST98844.1 EamA family transporter [Photobacterium iliopiscarium]
MIDRSPMIGFFLAMTTAVFWGALPIAMKQAVEVMDPFTIVWYRFIVAAFGLGLFLMWRKKLPIISNLGRMGCVVLIIGSLGLAGNFVLYNSSLKYLNSHVVQVLIQLAPVMLLVSSAWVFKEKLGRHQVVGVIALIGGLILFFNERLIELFTSFSGYTVGVSLAVTAALVWVVYGLAQKWLLRQFSSAQILLMIYVICAVILTPMAQPQQIFAMDNRQLGMLLFCCINTLVGYGAFAEAMSRWQASQVSAVITLAPLFTILFVDLASLAWPQYVTTASLNIWGYLGAIVVVGGAVCCAIGHKFISPSK